MSNKQKKRTKRYQGEDAKPQTSAVSSEAVVHRYEAVERSRLGEWWQAKKKTVKISAIIAAVVSGILWLGFELFTVIL